MSDNSASVMIPFKDADSLARAWEALVRALMLGLPTSGSHTATFETAAGDTVVIAIIKDRKVSVTLSEGKTRTVLTFDMIVSQ